MNKRDRDSLIDEIRQEERARDSLAGMLGYWLLQNKSDVYRAISLFRYQKYTPPTPEQEKAAQGQIDRLSHEWNRTQSAYQMRTKKIDELRAKLKATTID